MTLKVQHIESRFIAQAWSMVAGYIDEALKYTDDCTTEQAKLYLSSGTWLLMVAVDELQKIHGAITVAFENGPNDRTAILTALGGKDVVNDDIFSQVCSILKTIGATRVQCYARDSAVRLYKKVGLNKKATLLECKL